jgi:hypothetical protein
MEISVTSIRKYAYAVLLAAATLNVAPSLASAQAPAHGKFTLTHEVHFGTAKVPAGEYVFSYDPNGVTPVLTLSKMSGPRAGFMVLVPFRADSKPSDTSKLLLESTPDGKYVSAMQLPDSGITLHFDVPSRLAGNQVAQAATTAAAAQ